MKREVNPKNLVSLKETPFVGAETQNGNKLIFLQDSKGSIFTTCLHDAFIYDYKTDILPKVANDSNHSKVYTFDNSVEWLAWMVGK